MMNQTRMSPLTAMVIGIFGTGGVAIVAVSAIVLSGMRIIDTKASAIIDLAEGTVMGLPDLLESLPPALADLLDDRRAPAYASEIDIDVTFAPHQRRGGVRPVLTVTNNGSEVVSLLGVRIVALNKDQVPVREWTEMVATPIGLDDNDWRGPLMPGSTRYVMVSCWPTIDEDKAEGLTAVTETTNIRVWKSGGEL